MPLQAEDGHEIKRQQLQKIGEFLGIGPHQWRDRVLLLTSKAISYGVEIVESQGQISWKGSFPLENVLGAQQLKSHGGARFLVKLYDCSTTKKMLGIGKSSIKGLFSSMNKMRGIQQEEDPDEAANSRMEADGRHLRELSFKVPFADQAKEWVSAINHQLLVNFLASDSVGLKRSDRLEAIFAHGADPRSIVTADSGESMPFPCWLLVRLWLEDQGRTGGEWFSCFGTTMALGGMEPLLLHPMIIGQVIGARDAAALIQSLASSPERGTFLRSIHPTCGNSWAHAAAMCGDNDLLQELILLDVDLNLPDSNGDTPIHLALKNGQIGTAEYLLRNTSETIEESCRSSQHCVLIALSKNWMYFVEPLMLRSNGHFKKDENGLPLFHICALQESVGDETLLCCLQTAQQAELETQGPDGNTLLHICVANKRLRVVQALVSMGANVNASNHLSMTPLHLCLGFIEEGITDHFEDCLDILLQVSGHDTTIQARDSGNTVIHSALNCSLFSVAAQLVSADIRGLFVCDKDGCTPIARWISLHGHAIGSNPDCAPSVIQGNLQQFAHAGVKAFSKSDGSTTAHMAAAMSNSELVSILVYICPKQATQADRDGQFLSHICAAKNLFNTVLCLRGRALCAQNSLRQTCLHVAVAGDCIQSIKCSIWAGIPVSLWDAEGQNALHRAVLSSNRSCTHAILDSYCRFQGDRSGDGAPDCKGIVDLPNSYGQSPLHIAVASGDASIAILLLQFNASLWYQDSDKSETVVHLCCRLRNWNMLDTLYKHSTAQDWDIALSVRNHADQTAADVFLALPNSATNAVRPEIRHIIMASDMGQKHLDSIWAEGLDLQSDECLSANCVRECSDWPLPEAPPASTAEHNGGATLPSAPPPEWE